jgi:hypothetical protein
VPVEATYAVDQAADVEIQQQRHFQIRVFEICPGLRTMNFQKTLDSLELEQHLARNDDIGAICRSDFDLVKLDANGHLVLYA